MTFLTDCEAMYGPWVALESTDTMIPPSNWQGEVDATTNKEKEKEKKRKVKES